MRVCLGCHGQWGKATQVKVTVHPTVPMRNAAAPGAPGFLPLADEKGTLGPEGRITCRTCHTPHGRLPGAGMPVVDPAKVTDEELHDLATLLRPYSAPNLCTGCHGFQGMSYYLYYHFPGETWRLTLHELNRSEEKGRGGRFLDFWIPLLPVVVFHANRG